MDLTPMGKMNPMNPMEMCHMMMQGMFRMVQGMFRMMPMQSAEHDERLQSGEALPRPHDRTAVTGRLTLEALRQQYARGEISEAEFEVQRKLLSR
jgi:uncharacterized membrane protein